ncbi:methyltransferase domain-containing protein [Candidatus Falkowbacteria bacterium]|nr:methyltransferase domain-containing protein [Candidatus Falkowbacteria bacterium]
MPYLSGGNKLLNPAKIFNRLGINAGDKIADLGCGGAGHFILPAARLAGNDTTVYAVDIMKSVLQSVGSKARLEGIPNVKTVWSNLENYGATKIKKESLDIAFLINILFQSKNHQAIVKEALRLLKKNGKLLIIDWNELKSSFGPPADVRLKKADIKKIAADLKLKLMEEFAAGKYHFGLIFEK